MAGYIGVMMMKHMIFHGIPVMNQISPEQNEILREKDAQIGLKVVEGDTKEIKDIERSLPAPEKSKYVRAMNSYQVDLSKWREEYSEYVDCGGVCMEYPVQPVFNDYYEANH